VITLGREQTTGLPLKINMRIKEIQVKEGAYLTLTLITVRITSKL
jgi:hypothetical protein